MVDWPISDWFSGLRFCQLLFQFADFVVQALHQCNFKFFKLFDGHFVNAYSESARNLFAMQSLTVHPGDVKIRLCRPILVQAHFKGLNWAEDCKRVSGQINMPVFTGLGSGTPELIFLSLSFFVEFPFTQ